MREFESTFKTDIRESCPKEVGNVPDIALELIVRESSLLRYPTLSGMVPTRFKPANDIDFTSPPIQVTPPQLDEDPVHIDTTGVLPLHCQPARP